MMLRVIRYLSIVIIITSVLVIFMLANSALYAQKEPDESKTIQTCKKKWVLPPKMWTPQENWVWDQVCQGKCADFNTGSDYGGKLDPRNSNGWLLSRVLRQAFLKTILLYEPYFNAISHTGICIKGAWFREPINLSGATLTCQLFLIECRFESNIYLTSLVSNQLISFRGSKFVGNLNMDSIKTERGIFLDYAVFNEVDLRSGKIEGLLSLRSSCFNSKLIMASVQVGKGLYMDENSRFNNVDLRVSKIEGQLTLRNAQFSGHLNMDSIRVGRSLFMDEKSKFLSVDLRRASVGDELSMRNAQFLGNLNMDSVRVGTSICMNDKSMFKGETNLVNAIISSDLDISNSSFNILDLTSASIKRELRVGKGKKSVARWLKTSKLFLRNTQAGSVLGPLNAWPKQLELDGFTYQRFNMLPLNSADEDNIKEFQSYKQWLEKDKSFSSQPYEQLADFLRKEGRKEIGDDILYASKNRELEYTRGISKYLELFFLKIFIGYGYRIYYSIIWCLAFISLGVVVLRISGQGRALRMPYGITYSLDMLLPIVQLRKFHYDIDLRGWARYYFYFHKLMGYILASFLIAGLSGFTK